MTIHHPPENLIIVDLPFRESQIAEELKSLNEAVAANPDCDVIVNFSSVEIVTSSNLSNLLKLHKRLSDRGRQLLLCNVSAITKCVFSVANLDGVFAFVEDTPAAVAAVHKSA